MKKKTSKTVVVIGMHRSGTSMIGGILNILGVNMGNIIKRKASYNPLGYFEDQDFLNLNREILKDAGGSWSDPPEEHSIISVKDIYEKKIQNLIKDKPKIWGWKDPRTSLTIEFFIPHMSNPYIIVCYRNSISVANSLFKRYYMEREKAIEIKTIYDNRIEDFFKKYPDLNRLDVFYDKVILNPIEWVIKIIDFLDIRASPKKIRECVNFIKKPEQLIKLKNVIKLKRYIKKFLRKHFRVLYFLLKRVNFFEM